MEFLGTKLSLEELASIWEMQVRRGGGGGGERGGREEGGREKALMVGGRYVVHVHVVRGGEGVRE